MVEPKKEKRSKRGYWVGKKGLDRAKKIILGFYEENGRIPRVKDLPRIADAAQRGNWKEFGIFRWNDILSYFGFTPHIDHGKWVGKQGLEIAKQVILDFVKREGRTPTMKEVHVGISASAYRGHWQNYGISSWNDFIRYCELKPVSEHGIYTGEEGLERARQEILAFVKREGCSPLAKDLQIGVSAAANRGEYKKYNITNWTELVRSCGLTPAFEHRKYVGEEGLKRAKQEILSFVEMEKRTPSIKDVAGGINAAAQRGVWKKWKISSWVDLIRYCGLEPISEPNKYTGEVGFKRAKREILLFAEKEGRAPTGNDVEPGIYAAAFKGYYCKYGISSWVDLIRACDLEPRFEVNKYTGKKGLERAKKIVLAAVGKEGQIPLAKDIEKGISRAVQRGVWVEWGILCWADFLRYCGLEPEVERNKWIGKKGLERAKEEALSFFERGKRAPTSKDELSRGIENAANNGYWIIYGINCWNDFLRYCGLEVNLERNIYVGKEGLTRAKQEIQEFLNKEGRTPNCNEISAGIINAAFGGFWEGIGSWVDLLGFCNLAPNKGAYGYGWKKWEMWCETALLSMYPNKIQIKPRLNNKSIPDFIVHLSKSTTVIIDAKINSKTGSIKGDIDKYINFCEKLEFWCLFNKREKEIYNQKEICFYTPDQILERMIDRKIAISLENELAEVIESLNEEKKVIQNEDPRTLDYWLS